MKRILLIIVGIAVAVAATCQTKIIPVKKDGQYVAPLFNPVTGVASDVIVDSVNFWKPPIPTIPVDDTTRIDARNAATFVGSWTNGATTEPGWYKKTIAYSSVAGNTATFKFQGTRIELWAETKPNHGTGTVTIRNGTTIVETVGVSFISTTAQLPVKIYTNIKPLNPLTNYSIELKVTQGNNMLDFYVVQNYAQSTADTDPIPQPPIGNLINVSPTQDVQNILQTATNTIINFLPGTYRLKYTKVNPSIIGLQATPGTVTIVGIEPSADQFSSRALLEFIGGSTAGQYARGLIIDGNNTAQGGIYVDRDNVNVDLKIINSKFFGAWFNDCTNIVAKLYLKDNSWCNASWASGEIIIGGNIAKADFDLEWYTTSPNRGYGLKVLWQNSSNASLSPNTFGNIKIDLDGELNHSSNWANGKSRNIGVELFGCKITGELEITGIIKNQISLHPQQATNNIRIHDFVATTSDTYFIEAIGSNTKVEDGVIYNTGMMGANFQDNEHVSNVWFDNVRFVQPNGLAAGYGGVNLVGHKGVSNYKLTNCTVEVLRNFPLTKWMKDPKTGVVIDGTNKIIYL